MGGLRGQMAFFGNFYPPVAFNNHPRDYENCKEYLPTHLIFTLSLHDFQPLHTHKTWKQRRFCKTGTLRIDKPKQYSRSKWWNKYFYGTNITLILIQLIQSMEKCHSLKMSNALSSSIMSSAISFPFVMFAFDFVAFTRFLHLRLSFVKSLPLPTM